MVCLFYCAEALQAPFFGGLDMLSNLLPVAHYRVSILEHHAIPWYTDLWYGGRYQWMNPLWNFMYIPSTVIFLIWPLQWATRIVLCGHLIFSALVGRSLASVFFKDELRRVMGALLLIASFSAALFAGHLEKILAWPWVLLGLLVLLDAHRDDLKRGLLSGICLGIIALAGANYYVLYAGILYTVIIASFANKRLVLGFITGSLTGILHLPTVWHLFGYARGDIALTIPRYSVTFSTVFNELFIGTHFQWERFAIIGAPMICLLAWCSYCLLFRAAKVNNMVRRRCIAFLVAASILTLLATGTLYQGHHLLDTFRLPSRAMPFVAVAILLFIFSCSGDLVCHAPSSAKRWIVAILMVVSVVQVSLTCWTIRPIGSKYWLDNSGATEIAMFLKSQKAHSVWIDNLTRDMLIHLALNLNGISVPIAYYGDMGQTVPITGAYCGYSFDFFLVDHSERQLDEYDLLGKGKIPASNMHLVNTIEVAERRWDVYRVVCGLER
jgi:hypothetical protein